MYDGTTNTLNHSSSRRRAIPRPWLEQQQRSRQHEYASEMMIKGAPAGGLELGRSPSHGVSWDKLMNCFFCLRDQEDAKNKSTSSHHEGNGVSGPAFPVMQHFRRHSSSGSSFGAIENVSESAKGSNKNEGYPRTNKFKFEWTYSDLYL